MTTIVPFKRRKVGSDSITHLAGIVHSRRCNKVLVTLIECGVETYCAQLVNEYMCPPNRARTFLEEYPGADSEFSRWRLELN